MRLRAAIARTDRLLAREVVGEGLTRTEFSLLGAVARAGELRMAALVERERVHPTMLSRIVGRLAAAGWVTRVADPDDGRAALVAVTEPGAALYEQLQRERARRIEEYLAGLPEADAGLLSAALPVLDALADHLLAAGDDRQSAPLAGAAHA